MTVTGTITTDGVTGQLQTSDILDWNLLLNDGTNTFDLLHDSNRRMIVLGSDLTASSDALSFNYSGTDSGFFLIQDYSVGDDYWCAETDASCASGPAGDVLAISQYSDYKTSSLSGTQVLATAESSSAPEPSSMVLLGAGIAVLGFRKRLAFHR